MKTFVISKRRSHFNFKKALCRQALLQTFFSLFTHPATSTSSSAAATSMGLWYHLTVGVGARWTSICGCLFLSLSIPPSLGTRGWCQDVPQPRGINGHHSSPWWRLNEWTVQPVLSFTFKMKKEPMLLWFLHKSQSFKCVSCRDVLPPHSGVPFFDCHQPSPFTV